MQEEVMQWVPWFRFQVLMRRLRSLDACQSVLWNVCAILIDELMRAKVGTLRKIAFFFGQP